MSRFGHRGWTNWGDPRVKAGVYVVVSARDGLYKIGMSGNIERRLKHLGDVELFSWVPCRDREQAVVVESCLHSIFADRHVEGEWFDLQWCETDIGDFDDPVYVLEQYCAGLSCQSGAEP